MWGNVWKITNNTLIPRIQIKSSGWPIKSLRLFYKRVATENSTSGIVAAFTNKEPSPMAHLTHKQVYQGDGEDGPCEVSMI
jgi:hypothetical protein